MKIKITQPGWAGYTGLLGMVEFIDGVSADEVSRADAAQIGGIVSVEDVESGRNPSASQLIVDSRQAEAPVEAVAAAPAEPVSAPAHSKASLEAVADQHGIKGIRELADPLGLKGNSIAELIEKILTAQPE